MNVERLLDHLRKNYAYKKRIPGQDKSMSFALYQRLIYLIRKEHEHDNRRPH